MTNQSTSPGEPDLFEAPPLKLDFGCGRTPKDGFEGVDRLDFGQKHTHDLTRPWPWANESVDEAFSSHFIEHLDGVERVFFMNELYRVLKVGAAVTLLAPHWSNDCAYGDPTHKWPPISNWTHLYWNKAWRDVNAPHTGYTCDFDCPTLGYSYDGSPHLTLVGRSPEFQGYATNHYRNAMRDIWFNLVKRAP